MKTRLKYERKYRIKINTKENGILTRVKQEKEEFHKYIIPQNMVDKITILIDYK